MFAFQQTSTEIILFMVVLLVVEGVTFAALQFWYGFLKAPGFPHKPAPWAPTLRAKVGKPRRNGLPEGTSPVDFGTDLELSTAGFKVKSSVVGLLLLLISMGFFFLYIRYVYPMQEEGQVQQQSPTNPRQSSHPGG